MIRHMGGIPTICHDEIRDNMADEGSIGWSHRRDDPYAYNHTTPPKPPNTLRIPKHAHSQDKITELKNYCIQAKWMVKLSLRGAESTYTAVSNLIPGHHVVCFVEVQLG